MKIGNKTIGNGNPCFIIAEIGANWKYCNDPEKNYEHTLKLIDLAKEAGADAAKFQVYRAKKLYPKEAGLADYLKNPKSIYQIIEEMELPYEWIPKLKDYCDKKGIIFMATPFDEQSADELEKAGVEIYKIASYTISHLPLLEYIAKKRKPMILSTGASNLEDIRKAVEIIKSTGNTQIALMQCTAKYPAPLTSLNLKTIPKMKELFNLPVGFSDHSRNPVIGPVAAVALGANILEKHCTSNNNLEGPDHKFAVLMDEFKEMVNAVRETEKTLGSNEKSILRDEEELYKFARMHVHTLKAIKKGEKFTDENTAVLRSGKIKPGVDPYEFKNIVGKTAKRNLKEGEGVQKGDY